MRPVRIIVGFTPGGTTDIAARLIGQWLSERLAQQFVIENRPGASGNIATEAVVRAPPDGYTLLVIASSVAINATLYDNLNFNFIRDIAPVAGVFRGPYVMVVNPSVPNHDGVRVNRLRQGQSPQTQHGVARHRHWPPHCGRTVQDDGRRRHGARAVSRRWALAHQSDRGAGAGDIRIDAGLDWVH